MIKASEIVKMPVINSDYIEIRPIELKEAQYIVNKFHKHNIQPQGHKFSLGIFRKQLDDFVAGDDYEGLHDWIIIDEFDSSDDTLEEFYDEDYGHMNYSNKYDAYVLNLGGDFVYANPKPENVLLGVATVGIPVACPLNDGKTLEITRICFVNDDDEPCFDSQLPQFSKDHASPIPSMFTSAIIKKVKEMGYKKLITYTRIDEPAKYLKAVGFIIEFTQTRIKKWKSKNADKIYSKSAPSLKNRWSINCA